ncbi:hypothetical protein [Planctomicrobium piriforme]|uniref:Uncharacterized protein n=1 Tax=Planctomicrobium piriforme TaxID=1576369 RepID=A0A1I3MV76_9PLAN|nr:hypothetical protein [Planctomicrobium piriforme]SFJ00903.1 hypothetical protein SAMN05421753_114120 [Planctomicrobium piriforme]
MVLSIRLFKHQNVNDAWIERREKMERECAGISDDIVLSADLNTLSQNIAEKYLFDIPDILADQLSYEEPVFTRGNEKAIVVWHIPIRGDATILGMYDRSSPLSPVYDVTVDNGVILVRTNPHRDRITDGKKVVDNILAQVGDYLPDVAKSLTHFNDRFAQFARLPLEKRRDELQANQKAKETLSQIGVPIRKRTDDIAKAFVPPARKQISVPDSSQSVAITPVLEMKAYEEILDTLCAMAHGIERSPETFDGMGEEDIRIVLLIGLNAVYEGKATGETFNGVGKTDILIRVADRNIFIAECLVWDGEVKFAKKLNDQLLNYAVWRDTKTALIVFNRSKSLTSVIKTIDGFLAKHPQFVSKFDFHDPTVLKYVFRRLDDPDRHFYLTCLTFNVPEKHE